MMRDSPLAGLCIGAPLERTLGLYNDLAAATVPADKKLHPTQIEVGQEIDALVYELYGLTEEEIAIVEDQIAERSD